MGVVEKRVFLAPDFVSMRVAWDLAKQMEPLVFEIASRENVVAFVKSVTSEKGEYELVLVVEGDERIANKIAREIRTVTVRKGLKIINFMRTQIMARC